MSSVLLGVPYVHFYRPQMKLQECIVFTGVCGGGGVHPDGCNPLDAPPGCTPGMHPQMHTLDSFPSQDGCTTPGLMYPPPPQEDRQSPAWRYASYWNAYLSMMHFTLPNNNFPGILLSSPPIMSLIVQGLPRPSSSPPLTCSNLFNICKDLILGQGLYCTRIYPQTCLSQLNLNLDPSLDMFKLHLSPPNGTSL